VRSRSLPCLRMFLPTLLRRVGDVDIPWESCL
jgi:hypothetical protein